VLVATLLQAQFLPALLPNISQFIPDLVLLVVVSWALLLEERWALPGAFGAGLFLDLVSNHLHPIGFNALLFTLLALVVNRVTPNPASVGVLRSVPIALGATIVYQLASLLVEQVMGYNNLQANLLLRVILPLVVIDAALMVIIFALVRSLTRVKAPRQ
jgi:rod shape-determining protein MreD